MKDARPLLERFRAATPRTYQMWHGPTGSGVVDFDTAEVIEALEQRAELLAALEACWDARNSPGDLGTAMYNARAAIAKAKGE